MGNNFGANSASTVRSTTFKYTRGMRDGSTKELTGIIGQQQRIRTGKTEKDKKNTKKGKANG